MSIDEDYSKKLLKQNERILVSLLVLIGMIGVLVFVLFNSRGKNETMLLMDNVSEKREIGKLNKIVDNNDSLYVDIEYPSIGYKEIDRKIEGIVKGKIERVRNIYENKDVNYYYFLDYEVYVGMGDIVSLVINDRVDNVRLRNVENNREIYYFSLKREEEIEASDIFSEGYDRKRQELGIDSELFYIKNDKIVYVLEDKEIDVCDVKEYLNIDSVSNRSYSNSNVINRLEIVNKEYMVVRDCVMYDRSSLDGNIVMTYGKDMIVNVHGELDNGFSMVYYDGGVGYIEKKYLKNIEKDEEVINTDREIWYVDGIVSVRDMASNAGNKVGSLSDGEMVYKSGEMGDWIRIDYKGEDGYVRKGTISRRKKQVNTLDMDVVKDMEIDVNKPMVAITFDDGPNDNSTVKILDVLEEYKVKATFFDLGKLMLRYPEIVKREARLGEVGTHTYSHLNLNELDDNELKEELRLSVEAYKQVLGVSPKLVRAPYGNANATVKSYITDMAIINWNVDSLDWKYRNKKLILNEIDKYGDLDGKIVLMHSIHASTAEAFKELVPKLLDSGYQLVTISELAYYKKYTLETGTVFYYFK